MKPQFQQPVCDECRSRLGNIFCTLTSAQVSEMDSEKNCSIYKKGQIIFNEGNKPAGVYCVNKGKIKIFQTGEEGKEQILRLAKEGDILGYRSLISGEVYAGTAAVLEDATVCFIPKRTFFDFLNTNARLSTQMMQLLSHDLKKAEERLTGLAQKPVRERMAEALLMLQEFFGTDKNGIISTVISREDIANIVGIATETAIRILSEFKNENLIELIGKRIKVINQQGLLKTAHIFD
ncbi:MAG: Crp/Fnr family transcriptional regulator [Ignavibacteria bacterium]|nr:Crp/Fnr family transcriptional regulator [Ignavibacteria bacterium]